MATSEKHSTIKKSYKKIFLEEGDVIYLIHDNIPINKFQIKHITGKYAICDNNVKFFKSIYNGIEVYRGFSFGLPCSFVLETKTLKREYWRLTTIEYLSALFDYSKLSDDQLNELSKFVKQLKSNEESHEK